jgi:hypothetical protein
MHWSAKTTMKTIVSHVVADRWPNPPEAPEESRSLNTVAG